MSTANNIIYIIYHVSSDGEGNLTFGVIGAYSDERYAKNITECIAQTLTENEVVNVCEGHLNTNEYNAPGSDEKMFVVTVKDGEYKVGTSPKEWTDVEGLFMIYAKNEEKAIENIKKLVNES